MLAENDDTDLCVDDPGFDPDVSFVSDLKTMTQLWLGDTTPAKAQCSGKLGVLQSNRAAVSHFPMRTKLTAGRLCCNATRNGGKVFSIPVLQQGPLSYCSTVFGRGSF